MRLRYVALSGTTDTAVSGADVTFSSPGFADLPVVADPDRLFITMDPREVNGPAEVVDVTAHVAASTSITVARAQQTAYGGSTARDHPLGTAWVHGPTPVDLFEMQTSATHSDAADSIALDGKSTTVILEADIENIAPTIQLAEVTLVLVQGTAGGVLTSTTGITINWGTGGAPTLATATDHFDVVRLTRLTPDGSYWLGEVVGLDLTV